MWLFLSAADPGASEQSFYMLACMLLLGVAVLVAVGRWYRQWRNPVDRLMSRDEARELFAQLLSERIGVAMRAGELDAIIIEKWNQWPLEYRPALYDILRQAQLMEEIQMHEAIEKGIYPKRVMTDGPPPPAPPVAPIVEAPAAATPPTTRAAVARVVPIGGGHRWIGNQLLRTG